MTELDPGIEAVAQRWVDEAPPLSETQKDAIASAMRGALKPDKPRGGNAE